MFTGIIQNQGIVTAFGKKEAQAQLAFRWVKKEKRALFSGESIAVNGVCLTVRRVTRAGFEVDVIRETLQATTLGSLIRGECVNLERALRLGDAFGGHFVTGHVDEVGEIIKISQAGRNRTFFIRAGKKTLPLIAAKGSVTLEGISLTVQQVRGEIFEVGIVPHTLSETTLTKKKTGDRVNIEADLIARYLTIVSEILPKSGKKRGSLMSLLTQQGF